MSLVDYIGFLILTKIFLAMCLILNENRQSLALAHSRHKPSALGFSLFTKCSLLPRFQSTSSRTLSSLWEGFAPGAGGREMDTLL